MSIRIREIEGCLVALCAAKSTAKEGDIYLDDAAHYALARKFEADFAEEGIELVPNPEYVSLMDIGESDNANSDWWHATYMSLP